jgi:lipopolysaccharide export system protein LptA
MKPGQTEMPTKARPFLRSAAAVLLFALAVGANDANAASAAPPSMTGLTLSAKEPIKIDADRLEVHEKQNKAIFTGNVSVVQGKTLMKASKLVVFYAKGSGGSVTTGAAAIDHIEATGKVYVRSDKQVATGDAATFNMGSQLLVMTGSKVVLTDGDNVAVGCKLTVRMQTGKARLDSCKGGRTGRVSIVVAPRSLPETKPGSKAGSKK